MRIKNVLGFLCVVVFASATALAQTKTFNRYEVEILLNPTVGKKDTREVNAVVIFETDKVVVKSRRNSEIFKEMKYSDVRFAEHSFSKRPWITQAAVSALTAAFTGLPFYIGSDEKHWISVVGTDDFFVLKLENDNFRQIKAEFMIRNVELDDIGIDGKSINRKRSKDEQPNKTDRDPSQE